jgi:condensin complex subunit 2
LPDISLLDNKAISHSLAGFSFSKDAFALEESTLFRDDGHRHSDDEDNDFGGMDHGGGDDFPMDVNGGDGAPVEDFFVGEQAVGDDFGGEGDIGIGQEDFGGDGESIGSGGVQQGGPAMAPLNPLQVPNERDLVMAMTDADGEGGMMDYFDQTFLKNWAGPEHWKLRKVVRRRKCMIRFLIGQVFDVCHSSADAAETNASKPKREKKEAFKIDFSTPSDKDLKETSEKLFAPVTRGAGINLPGTSSSASKSRKRSKKAKEKEKKDDHRLPDDMHFSSRQLVTLFLKPKFSVCNSVSITGSKLISRMSFS